MSDLDPDPAKNGPDPPTLIFIRLWLKKINAAPTVQLWSEIGMQAEGWIVEHE
jgi:hypothetical protein